MSGSSVHLGRWRAAPLMKGVAAERGSGAIPG